VTSKRAQGHWHSYHSVGRIWFPIYLLL